MKTITTIAFGLVVLLAAVFFLLGSLCTVDRGMPGDFVAVGAVVALISLAVMIGGIILIARINRKEQTAVVVTPEESVTTSKSQVDENN